MQLKELIKLRREIKQEIIRQNDLSNYKRVAWLKQKKLQIGVIIDNKRREGTRRVPLR